MSAPTRAALFPAIREAMEIADAASLRREVAE